MKIILDVFCSGHGVIFYSNLGKHIYLEIIKSDLSGLLKILLDI